MKRNSIRDPNGIMRELDGCAVNFQAFNVPAGPMAKIEVFNLSSGTRRIRTFDNVSQGMAVWCKALSVDDLLNMIPVAVE